MFNTTNNSNMREVVFVGMIVMLIILSFEEDYKTAPKDISFAESVCEEGGWKSVDRSEVICKDGAIYKRGEK